MRWLHDNRILHDNTTFTPNSVDAGYPFIDAFLDTRLAVVGRTTATAGITFDFDFGEQVFLNYFAILGHNLTSSAVMKLYANTSSDIENYLVEYDIDYNSPVVLHELEAENYADGYYYLTGKTGQYIGGDASPTEFDYYLVDELGNQIEDEFSNEIYGFIWRIDTTLYNVADEFGNLIWGNILASGYRYWILTIEDPSNADGYIEISKMFFGDYLQLPYMGKTQKLPTATTSTQQFSPTGCIYTDKGITYKYGNVTFPVVEDDEKTAIDAVFAEIDKSVPFILLIWENDLTFQPPIYSILTTDLDWQRVADMNGRRWSFSFGFREIF